MKSQYLVMTILLACVAYLLVTSKERYQICTVDENGLQCEEK